MLQSHIITVDGQFVGAAVRLDHGYRFVAIDLRLYDLDETMWPTLGHIERLAQRLCRTGGFGDQPRRVDYYHIDRHTDPGLPDPGLQVGG